MKFTETIAKLFNEGFLPEIATTEAAAISGVPNAMFDGEANELVAVPVTVAGQAAFTVELFFSPSEAKLMHIRLADLAVPKCVAPSDPAWAVLEATSLITECTEAIYAEVGAAAAESIA